MEIPEFCTRASQRLKRTPRSELETDPDYNPKNVNVYRVKTEYEIPGIKKVWEERRVVRRSKQLELDRNRPPAKVQFIDRAEYSIENWKDKAAEAQKNREHLKRKRVTKNTKIESGKSLKAKFLLPGRQKKAMATDSKDDEEQDIDEFDATQLNVIAGELDPYALFLESRRGINADNFDLNNLPNYVMGSGKGEEGGPPAFEFKSMWNYNLFPATADDTEEGMKKNRPWEHEDPTIPDFKPEVLAIVASFSIGNKLDLKMIALASRNLEFNPDRFAPLIMRIREPKSTGLIFASGRVVVTGTKSEEQCRKAARKYARVVQKCGYKVQMLNFDIQNIAASCNLKFRVRLNHLSMNKLYGNLSYEPELFPGLVIPLEFPRVKVIVFCTGSVLMTGAKSMSDLETALKKVYPLIKMYAH